MKVPLLILTLCLYSCDNVQSNIVLPYSFEGLYTTIQCNNNVNQLIINNNTIEYIYNDFIDKETYVIQTDSYYRNLIVTSTDSILYWFDSSTGQLSIGICTFQHR